MKLFFSKTRHLRHTLHIRCAMRHSTRHTRHMASQCHSPPRSALKAVRTGISRARHPGTVWRVTPWSPRGPLKRFNWLPASMKGVSMSDTDHADRDMFPLFRPEAPPGPQPGAPCRIPGCPGTLKADGHAAVYCPICRHREWAPQQKGPSDVA